MADDVAEIGVIGPTSDPVVVGDVGGRSVAFCPRHGTDHRLPPHRIPYRADLWALRSLGVGQVLAPCAVGSLDPALVPGTLVVCDQLVDRTSGRAGTYDDRGAVHVPFADPSCPRVRAVAVARARAGGWAVQDRGTVVVVEGPRFSTRAESQWFEAAGWSVVGMTGHPEAALARELALCFTTLALVTALGAGVEDGSSVTQAEVFEVFREHTARLRSLLLDVVTALPLARDCACPHALDGLSPEPALP